MQDSTIEKIKKLEAVLNLIDTDYTKTRDFVSAVDKILETVQSVKTLSINEFERLTSNLSKVNRDNSYTKSYFLKEIDDLKAFIGKLKTELESQKPVDEEAICQKAVEMAIEAIDVPDQMDTCQMAKEMIMSDLPETPEITGDELVGLINDLPITADSQIDASHIKNLPKFKNGGGPGTSVIKGLVAGTGVTIDNTNIQYPKISSTGGGGTGDVIGPATNSDQYIPQWNGADSKTLQNGLAVPAGGLAGLTALGTKLDASAFSDAGVTSKLITGFTSGAATVLATDTILQALNKIDGNVASKQASGSYEVTTNKATTFGTINDTLYPTVKAVNDAITTAVTGLLDYRGSYDASTNLFPATGGSGVIGAILKGDFWICSVAGTLGGTAVVAGDLIIALVDTPAQTASNWDLVEHDFGFTAENVSNKVTSISGSSTDVQYPSAKLLYDQLLGKGVGDMLLGTAQTVSETKTFVKDKLLVKGTSTGTTNITTANTSATDYTATLPAKDGTIAMLTDISVGLTWSAPGSNQTMVANNGYINNKNGTVLALTLPTTSAIGDIVRVVGGNNDSTWEIDQGANQYIKYGLSVTTTGVTGNLQGDSTYNDCVELVCIEANLGWVVTSSIGNIRVN